jgi:hypothetical protein
MNGDHEQHDANIRLQSLISCGQLDRMLERSVAQVNSYFMDHKLMLGVINVGGLCKRSRLVIPMVYFDTFQCIVSMIAIACFVLVLVRAQEEKLKLWGESMTHTITNHLRQSAPNQRQQPQQTTTTAHHDNAPRSICAHRNRLNLPLAPIWTRSKPIEAPITSSNGSRRNRLLLITRNLASARWNQARWPLRNL